MSAAASSLNAKAQPFQSNQSPKDPGAEQQDDGDRRVTPIPIENSTLERNHEVLNRLRAEILAGRHPLYKAPSDIAKGISELPERYQQGLHLPVPNEAASSDVEHQNNAENATPLSARIEPATADLSSSQATVSQERPAAKSSPVVVKRTLAAHLNDEQPNEATGQDTPSAAKKVRTQNEEAPTERNGHQVNDSRNSPGSASDPATLSRDETSVTTTAPSSATKESSALSLADRLAPPSSSASDSLQRSASGDKYSGQRLPPASQEERDRMRELRDRLLKERGAISRDRLEEAKSKNIDRYIPDRSERSDRSKPDYNKNADKTSLRERLHNDPRDRNLQARMEVDRPSYSTPVDRTPGSADVRLPTSYKSASSRSLGDVERPLPSYAQERPGRHEPAFREPSRLVDTDRNGLHSGRLDDRRGPTTAPLPISHRDTDRDLRYQGPPQHLDYDQRKRSDLGSIERPYGRADPRAPHGEAASSHFDERDRDRRLAELDVLWSRPADGPATRPGQDRRDLPGVQSARSDRYDTRDMRANRDSMPPYQREADYPPRFQPPASAPLPFYPERSDDMRRSAQPINAHGDAISRRPYPPPMAGRPPSPPPRAPQDRMYGDEITHERRYSDSRQARPVEYPGREEPRPRHDAVPPLAYPPAPLPLANERFDNSLGRSRGGRPYDETLPREARSESSMRDPVSRRDVRDPRDIGDVRGPPQFDAREYDRRGDRRTDQPINVAPPPRPMEGRPKERRDDDQARNLPEKLSASTSGPKGKPALGPVDSYRPGGSKPRSPPPASRSDIREPPPVRDARDPRSFDVPPPTFPPRGAPADPRYLRAYPPAPYGAPAYDDRGYPTPPVDSRMPPRGPPPAPYGAPYDDRDGYRGPPAPVPAYPYPAEHYHSGRTPPYRGMAPIQDGRYEDRYPPAIPNATAPRPYYDAYDARPVVPAPYDARDRGPYTAPPQAPGYPPPSARNDDYRRPDPRFDDYRRPDERRR